MTKVRPYSLMLFISLFLYSCDCIQHADGVVLDGESKQFIPNARVENSKFKMPAGFAKYSLSDSLGQFKVRYPLLGKGLFGCPDLKLTFSKPGYNSNEVVLNSTSVNDTVYLRKIK